MKTLTDVLLTLLRTGSRQLICRSLALTPLAWRHTETPSLIPSRPSDIELKGQAIRLGRSAFSSHAGLLIARHML